jgi:hypothetical protein
MAQTFLRIVVDGFQSGEFDFPAALQRKPGLDKAAFDDFISSLVVAEEDPSADTFWAVTFAGHADRDDDPGLTADQRRAAERDASRQRMLSAGNFVLTRVSDALSADGFAPLTTFNDGTNIAFDFVTAGAADLVNPDPASEAERAQNRRVKILAIEFSQQPQTLAFGEQNLDPTVA